MKEPRYRVIGRGLCGWHAQSVDCSSSGDTLDGYLANAEEGALVYDAQDTDNRAFTAFVLNGPMVDCKLAPDASDQFTDADRKRAQMMLPGLGGEFRTLAAIAIADHEYTGLDSVSVETYETLLRRIPRMKIGHVHSGAVVWEKRS